MPQKMFLIQGVFFQSRHSLHTEPLPGHNPVQDANDNASQFAFSGSFSADGLDEPQELFGTMVDCYGNSRIGNIKLTEERFSFIKRYEHRSDEIRYEFFKSGSIWVGKWSGRSVGSGYANCIVTEVPESFSKLRATATLYNEAKVSHPC